MSTLQWCCQSGGLSVVFRLAFCHCILSSMLSHCGKSYWLEGSSCRLTGLAGWNRSWRGLLGAILASPTPRKPLQATSGTPQNRLPEASESQLGHGDPQDTPRTSPRRPQDPSRTPPGAPQDPFKTASWSHLSLPDASKTLQVASGSRQGCPKTL